MGKLRDGVYEEAFKTGDKVYCADFRKDIKGTIIEVDTGSRMPYKVQYSDGETWWVPEGSITKESDYDQYCLMQGYIPPIEAKFNGDIVSRKFRVGDKVYDKTYWEDKVNCIPPFDYGQYRLAMGYPAIGSPISPVSPLTKNTVGDTTEDTVNNPTHYNSYPSIEVIQLTRHMNFCRGNAVKYIARAAFKGSELEDLRKAQWYINDEIKRLQGHSDA